MLRSLSAAMIAAYLVVPAMAQDGCIDLQASRNHAHSVAWKANGKAIDLDGYKAKAFLDAVNAMGDPTNYHAEHITIILVPGAPSAMVALSGNECGGYLSQGIVLAVPSVIAAYTVAIGITV